MRYLRRFNEDLSDEYKNVEILLKEFNSKKSALESIFDNSDEMTISEIESQILSKVFGGKESNQNPLLSRYSAILKIKRNINLIEEESNGDHKRKEEIKNDIRSLKTQSVKYPESTDYYEGEISKLEDSIKEIDSRVSSRSKEISEIQVELGEEESGFKEMMDKYSKSDKKFIN